MIGPKSGELTRIRLTKNLDDPVYGTLVPPVEEDLVYFVEYADRRSDDYTLTIFNYPELLSADATIVAPAHTNQPEKTVKDTRRISVVEG